MEPDAILYHLAHAKGLREDAIRAAREQRGAAAPASIDFVEPYVAGETSASEPDAALFFVFQLLGEWREKSAYRPPAGLLARDADTPDDLLGDAVTRPVSASSVLDRDPRAL